ncbi:MAG TPA: ABC transporter permease [Aquifex aeolicus]|uniref:ABC transporter permease n=1 Tax=Aquifex aeolicus TaxID=63363 RepID=A0A9D1CFU5_AQUAO|nr:ABC transporter permease [Aquificales bacterium]HIP98816.1 ABC transporter permease [Aquifex aeolicus]HIQ25779.1 ABC transporter permease [Aquifex aeolicus]
MPFSFRSKLLSLLNSIGEATLIALWAVWFLFKKPPKFEHFIKQLAYIGAETLPVVAVTSFFAGGVIVVETYSIFHRFNAEHLLGAVVAISMARELGPVLTALMVVARVGSAMTAQIGTMKITEQIDALRVLAVNPIRYLVTPRLFASILSLPLLTIVADVIGIFGGWFVAVKLFGVNDYLFWQKIRDIAELSDFTGGLLKSAVFGFLIAVVSCYFGFSTKGGTEGVGKATTASVVTASMLVLITDYFLSALLF